MLHDRYRAIASPGLEPPASTLETSVLPAACIAVPQVKQRTNYSCGPAAALSLLRHWRWEDFARVEEGDLHEAMGTTIAHGTEPEPMVDALRRVGGLVAEYRHGDVTLGQLERAVDAGQPPIVDLQAWRDTGLGWRETWDAGHYVILVGYDAERLFVMDPSVMTPGGYAFLPRVELEERWHDVEGTGDTPRQRMAIFVRGRGPCWAAESLVGTIATRLE